MLGTRESKNSKFSVSKSTKLTYYIGSSPSYFTILALAYLYNFITNDITEVNYKKIPTNISLILF